MDNNIILPASRIIAERLLSLRKSRGLTQKELANAVGIDLTSIKNYEIAESGSSRVNSNIGMKVDTLIKIAKFYGVSTDYILGMTDLMTPAAHVIEAQYTTGLNECSIDLLMAQAMIATGDSDADLTLEMVDEFIDFALDSYGKDSPVVLYWNFRKQYERMMASKNQTMLTTISDTGDVLMPTYAAADYFRTALCDRFKAYLQDLYPLPDDPSEEDGNGND